MAELKDSGARRDFGTGAVRDVAEGKGRCDLLPLGIVSDFFMGDDVLKHIDIYVHCGVVWQLFYALRAFAARRNWDYYTAILEVSRQYEDGCQKYGDRNWEKGIPLHCYIDSGVRHYLKFLRGDTDEPHDRAFIWNMLGAIWTHENKPELIDLPFAVAVNPITPATEDKPVEPWGEEDEARCNEVCYRFSAHQCESGECPLNTLVDGNNYLTCEEVREAHPAEARKIMDEMEGMK
jgi:hypothetical protein